MDQQTRNFVKELLARELIEESNSGETSLLVQFDATRPDVKVPLKFKRQETLVLEFGTKTTIPIPDLKLDNSGIHGTLSFGGVPFLCFVPWEATYAIKDGMGGRYKFWVEDMPESVRKSFEKESERISIQEAEKAKAPAILPVKGKKKEFPPYLRLVK